MRTSYYTLLFALAVCVCCSTVLSITSLLLHDRQEQSRRLDRQKNILLAARLKAETQQQVKQVFAHRVRPLVIDGKGAIVPGKLPDDLPKDSPLLPLYRILPPLRGLAASGSDKLETPREVAVSPKPLASTPPLRGAVSGFVASGSNELETSREVAGGGAYVYPIEGLGLWGPMHGYLAVSPDGREVVGVAFYEHEETPGLGGEISRPWFQDNFVGKLLYRGAQLVGIEVVKGKAKDHVDFAKRGQHLVDGMSGATITGRGITNMMRELPAKYEPFFMQQCK